MRTTDLPWPSEKGSIASFMGHSYSQEWQPGLWCAFPLLSIGQCCLKAEATQKTSGRQPGPHAIFLNFQIEVSLLYHAQSHFLPTEYCWDHGLSVGNFSLISCMGEGREETKWSKKSKFKSFHCQSVLWGIFWTTSWDFKQSQLIIQYVLRCELLRLQLSYVKGNMHASLAWL